MAEHISADELFCPQCSYNLRGIESDRCPECGLTIDRELLGRSNIPWTFRGEIGIFRAFIKTIFLAIRHPRKLGHASARPVDYLAAQKFRWLVVFFAWLPLAATVLVIRAMTDVPFLTIASGSSSGRSPSNDLLLCEFAGAMLWPVPSIALLMLIAAITGAGSYFFQPRSLSIEQQNRAIAISYYSCAPLALIFVPCIFFDAAAALAQFGDILAQIRLFIILCLAGGISLVGILASIEITSLKLLRFTTHCSFWRLVMFGVLLPIAWVMLLVLTLGLFPAMCGFVRLVIFSYQG